MSGNSLGASSVGRPSIIETHFQQRPISEIALVALWALLVGLIVLLFFAWLTSSNPGGRANGSLSAGGDCVSFGRGGAICRDHSAGDGVSHGAADPGSHCVGLGRAALLCHRMATK
jgi:hypothetical protein